MPWGVIRAVGVVYPLWRELARMSYLWRVPHALDGAALRSTVGELPATPVPAALREALLALGFGHAPAPFRPGRTEVRRQTAPKGRYRRACMNPGHASLPLLDVSDLRVTLQTANGPAEALRGVSFALERGGTLGLIGESGCGKSMTALALMGLLPEGAGVSGSIRFDGRELTRLDEDSLCALRGDRIAMVFQEPMTALNPLHRVGHQIAEPLRLHRGLDAAAARAEAQRLLERVQLPKARERLDSYPHQLSGGQRQRVVIAIALACGPDLLIADEPTTALDTTVQRECSTCSMSCVATAAWRCC